MYFNNIQSCNKAHQDPPQLLYSTKFVCSNYKEDSRASAHTNSQQSYQQVQDPNKLKTNKNLNKE